MVSFAVTAAVLVLGIGSFTGKYAAGVGGDLSWGARTRSLAARVCLVVTAVVVLLVPLDVDGCVAWRFEPATAVAGAFIVVVAEVTATAAGTRGGVAVAASALLFAAANAASSAGPDASPCGAGLYGASLVGILSSAGVFSIT